MALEILALADQLLGLLGQALADRLEHLGAAQLAGLDLRLAVLLAVGVDQLQLQGLQILLQLSGGVFGCFFQLVVFFREEHGLSDTNRGQPARGWL